MTSPLNFTYTMVIERVTGTVEKLGSYLERVSDWEEFGYHFLPEDKEYLVQVFAMHST